jgi:head-tail adaptor
MRWVSVESVFKVKVKVRAARSGMKARDEKASISRGFSTRYLIDITARGFLRFERESS